MRFGPTRGRHLSSSLLVVVLCCLGSCSSAADTIKSGESISGSATLVSAGGIFEFGLFHLENATDSRYYVGIWYYNTTPRVVVWVGNRDSPLTGSNSSSFTIKLGDSGNLTVLEDGGRAVWATNKSQRDANATATIHDDGDLVVRPEGGSGATTAPLWRSFDEPTDVLLSGMKITLDRSTGAGTKFTSWKTPTDPSSGNFTLGIDPRGTRQLVMMSSSGDIRWRTGIWDDSIDGFTGLSRMRPLAEYGFQLQPDAENPQILVFVFTYFNSTPVRFVLLPNGTETSYFYEKENGQWKIIWQQPVTDCELYNFCGSNSLCVDEAKAAECQCLAGFATRGGGSKGCQRIAGLRLDGFREMAAVKLPDMGEQRLGADSREACEGLCLGNATCRAYAYLNGEGCLTWPGDLVDMLKFTDGSNGAVLHVKVDPSQVVVPVDNGDGITNSGGSHKVHIAVIVVPAVLGIILIVTIIFLWWKYRSMIKEMWKKERGRRSESAVTDGGTSGEQHDYPTTLEVTDDARSGQKPFELPMFSLEVIESATENFSEANELGKGGFGRVYKATLPGGEHVAVKRLSKDSGQGQEEFKNEMILIAKLQHNNLVRLLGCCIQGDEKILIYEYMPNKSLDDFIFNPAKQPLLDWRKRFSIIEGVARGLLYLHRDSRLRIVHRDLKASNILLDEELNPKISDFGMARIFGGNQNSDSTTRVVGTFGYMSPEYAMEGLFSARSDVYSFGVLILEIISGRKNTKFRSDDFANLLGYAWQLWEENRAAELIDPSIRSPCSESEVLRCMHIALLCVQDRASDRPAMWPIVVMLGSEATIQDRPKQPTFASAGSTSETTTRYNDDSFSTYDVTITELKAR